MNAATDINDSYIRYQCNYAKNKGLKVMALRGQGRYSGMWCEWRSRDCANCVESSRITPAGYAESSSAMPTLKRVLACVPSAQEAEHLKENNVLPLLLRVFLGHCKRHVVPKSRLN